MRRMGREAAFGGLDISNDVGVVKGNAREIWISSGMAISRQLSVCCRNKRSAKSNCAQDSCYRDKQQRKTIAERHSLDGVPC
jgi:hypothetical protein